MKEKKRVLGYAREGKDANLDSQIKALEKIVQEDNILIDKDIGKILNTQSYRALKGAVGLREGDTLIITSLDRIAGNKEEILRELQWFREHGVRLKIMDIPTTMTEVPADQNWILELIPNILIEVFGSIAEQDRLTIRKRQREGIEAAKKKGKHLGRPRIIKPDDFADTYNRWKAGEFHAKHAMQMLGITRSTFYRTVKAYEKTLVDK